MKVSVKFIGGSKNGKLAVAEVTQFKRGMRIPVGEEVYVVQDGPIAELLETTQSSSDVLTVRAQLLEER